MQSKVSTPDVEFPETHYLPGYDEELFKQLEGKDIVIYDEHHGCGYRIRKATFELLERYSDCYSTIIVL